VTNSAPNPPYGGPAGPCRAACACPATIDLPSGPDLRRLAVGETHISGCSRATTCSIPATPAGPGGEGRALRRRRLAVCGVASGVFGSPRTCSISAIPAPVAGWSSARGGLPDHRDLRRRCSLRRRPMQRILDPLALMGPGGQHQRVPPAHQLAGAPIRSRSSIAPHALRPGQIRVLLAGLAAPGETVVIGPRRAAIIPSAASRISGRR